MTCARQSEWSSSSHNVRTTEGIDETEEKREGQKRGSVVQTKEKGKGGTHIPRKGSVWRCQTYLLKGKILGYRGM